MECEGCLSEHSMAGQTRGKFANNEPWPQLHWSNSKTLSCTCPIKSLKNSWRRVNRHGTDRLKPTPKPGNWINWRKKRCAIIAKGSASGSREARFETQPKIFRHVSTSAARHKGESEGKLSTIRCRSGKRQIQGDQTSCRWQPALFGSRDARLSCSWRAGERHCDLVLDWITQQLRAAHQRAAIETCRLVGNGTPANRVGEGRVGTGD